jgi:spore coat protein U-like protein
MFRNSIVPITAGVMLALAGSAQAAGTRTTTFPVTATVASNCLIDSASTMAFGNYDGSAPIDSTSAIAVRCSKNAPYTIALNGGGAASIAPRKMSFGTETLEYNLFSDAGRSTVWGSTVGTNTVGGTGSGLNSAITHTVYGRLFDNANNQAAAVGAYSDTIQVTIAY